LHVPNSANRQWLERPIKEREAITRSFVAKAVMKYQLTISLRQEIAEHSDPVGHLRLCQENDPAGSILSLAIAEFAGMLTHGALVKEYLCKELVGASRDLTAIVVREMTPTKSRQAKAPCMKVWPAK
jgi:hypothetical protein